MGSRTECALLQLAGRLGADYQAAREAAATLRAFPFSSERKRMSTLTRRLGARSAAFPGSSSPGLPPLHFVFLLLPLPTPLPAHVSSLRLCRALLLHYCITFVWGASSARYLLGWPGLCLYNWPVRMQ